MNGLITGIPNQSEVINKLFQFAQHIGGRPEQEVFFRGLCHGFSIVYGYMAATDNLPWWAALLTELIEWDGTEEKLNEIISLPGAREDNPPEFPTTRRNLFLRALDYLYFHQASESLEGYLQQQTLLQKDGVFESEQGKIVHHFVAAGSFSFNDIEELLDEKIFSKEVICLIYMDTHACAFRYAEDRWFFYDPNKGKEEEYSRKSNMANRIWATAKRYNGNEFGPSNRSSLSIDIATWKQDIDFSPLSEVYTNLIDKKPIDLVGGTGLHMMACYAPAQLPNLFTLAENDTYFGKKFAASLAAKDKNEKTGLEMILRYAPDQLDALFRLASKNEKFQIKMARLFIFIGLKEMHECAVNEETKTIICNLVKNLNKPTSLDELKTLLDGIDSAILPSRGNFSQGEAPKISDGSAFGHAKCLLNISREKHLRSCACFGLFGQPEQQGQNVGNEKPDSCLTM
ncbi:MAG: hypothetical protein A3F41_07350 [Coxiella sp. RIFCSPHIGHO2_12_FULL_44_14]|nr:MAG: hypothetical protein A3F41_07350 [Coxiella sp. RIFCSPHIGHO2_12_FULL_44_14]